jgi:hypothetical protein
MLKIISIVLSGIVAAMALVRVIYNIAKAKSVKHDGFTTDVLILFLALNVLVRSV